jgi:hypothetical protein
MDKTDADAPEQSKVMSMLNWMYEVASGDFDLSDAVTSSIGTGVARVVGKRFTSAEDLAAQYSAQHNDREVAIERLVSNQSCWITGSSLVLNLWGFVTMPVTLPANVVSAYMFQMRLVQTIAVLRGYDLTSDEVRSFVFVCLLGKHAAEALKAAGVGVANKLAKNLLKSVSGQVLRNINRQVSFRLFTKAGTTGVVNFVNWLPVISGAVCGSIDYVATRAMARAAQTYFPPLDPGYADATVIDELCDTADAEG